jgi:hypothetical protein
MTRDCFFLRFFEVRILHNAPGASQKSASFREKGLDVKFKKGDHLLDFIENATQYFTRTGLDTITYLPDPDDDTKMISVVGDYSKFDIQTTIVSSAKLRAARFDRYDRNNDDSARNWLLASVDDDLKKDISK